MPGDVLMEHIKSQNAACRSSPSAVLTADDDDIIICEEQQLPDPHHHDDDRDRRDRVHVSVKQTVEHLLGRLGLSKLTPLIDRTIVSQSDTDTIQVRVIRPTRPPPQSAPDDDDDDLSLIHI